MQEVLKKEMENYVTAKADLEAPVECKYQHIACRNGLVMLVLTVPREESSEAIDFSDKVEKLQLKVTLACNTLRVVLISELFCVDSETKTID